LPQGWQRVSLGLPVSFAHGDLLPEGVKDSVKEGTGEAMGDGTRVEAAGDGQFDPLCTDVGRETG